MQLVRTTLRLRKDLKNIAQKRALAEETSLQAVLNQALEDYLKQKDKKEAKSIVFKTHDLGEPLDNLTRADYYDEP